MRNANDNLSPSEIAGYAGAILRLRFALPGKVDQTDITLAEDGVTVCLMGYSGDDYATASFKLDKATTEEEFEESSWRRAFD